MQKVKTKKLNSLKLNQLKKAELERRSQSVLKGGSDGCNCTGYNYTERAVG